MAPGWCWLLPAAVLALVTGQAAAQSAPSVIILLSETTRGQAAEGRSEAPVVNQNGLVAAYSSDALDLVSPRFTNHRNQVYARDVEVIASELVSRSDTGAAGNRPSQNSGFPPGIDGEGRFVAFSSTATNLSPEDTDALEDVYVYDRELDVIEVISRGIDGPSNGVSTFPKLSADGRFVVFQSTATNLVENDENGSSDIFLYDRAEGVMRRVSIGFDGTETDGPSITPAISEDGRVVAFASSANNLVEQETPGAVQQIYVTDWENQTTVLASVNGAGAPGNAISFLPDLNGDGSRVAFKSEATNLVPGDTNGVPDVFVRDLANGTTERVSVDSFGNQANGLSGGPGISADGRFVAFVSFASNLVPEDGNGLSDVYVYDRFPPNRPQGIIARVTVGMGGTEPNGGVPDFPVSISADGRWIGFSSSASNLVPNDFNNAPDAFLACNPFDAFDCAPPTPIPTATPTELPDEPQCVGDCNGDGMVTIDDLIRMVNIALGRTPLCPNDVNDGCLAGDANCDCEITVDEIVRAVRNALMGCQDFGDCGPREHAAMCCGGPIDTRTPTVTPDVTPTAIVTGTATATVTPTPRGLCVGDCNDTNTVTIDELVRMVNIALGNQLACQCLAGDSNCNCQITVEEIVQAVNNALFGCTTFNMCPEPQHAMMCCG